VSGQAARLSLATSHSPEGGTRTGNAPVILPARSPMSGYPLRQYPRTRSWVSGYAGTRVVGQGRRAGTSLPGLACPRYSRLLRRVGPMPYGYPCWVRLLLGWSAAGSAGEPLMILRVARTDRIDARFVHLFADVTTGTLDRHEVFSVHRNSWLIWSADVEH